MREVVRSAIVPYPVESVYSLIADVQSYPEFLPGCTGSSIVSRDEGVVIASLSLLQGPLRATFTTRNEMQPPQSVRMRLVEGPFRELEGEWRLQPLGEQGCRIELRMRFEFSNAAADLVLGPVFAVTCNNLVAAFVRRAREKHG